jgi:hypothetical protein
MRTWKSTYKGKDLDPATLRQSDREWAVLKQEYAFLKEWRAALDRKKNLAAERERLVRAREGLTEELTAIRNQFDDLSAGIRAASKMDPVLKELADWKTMKKPEGIQDVCNHFLAEIARRSGIESKVFEYTAYKEGGRGPRWPAHEMYAMMKKRREWRTVTPAEAQKLADRGQFVVAGMPKPDAGTPGHVAVVVPSNFPREEGKKPRSDLPWVRDQECPGKSQGANYRFPRTMFREGKVLFFVYEGK